MKDRPLLAVYGSLRRGQRAHSFLTNPSFGFIGEDKVRGILYDTGYGYPGAVVDGKPEYTIDVELYEVLDDEALAPIHRYEGYYPDHPERSLFIPIIVRPVFFKQREAMIYEWNCYGCRTEEAAKIVPHGNWPRYLSERYSCA